MKSLEDMTRKDRRQYVDAFRRRREQVAYLTPEQSRAISLPGDVEIARSVAEEVKKSIDRPVTYGWAASDMTALGFELGVARACLAIPVSCGTADGNAPTPRGVPAGTLQWFDVASRPSIGGSTACHGPGAEGNGLQTAEHGESDPKSVSD